MERPFEQIHAFHAAHKEACKRSLVGKRLDKKKGLRPELCAQVVSFSGPWDPRS
jgi:hypothetical protein